VNKKKQQLLVKAVKSILNSHSKRVFYTLKGKCATLVQMKWPIKLLHIACMPKTRLCPSWP